MGLVILGLLIFLEFCSQAKIYKALIPGDIENGVMRRDRKSVTPVYVFGNQRPIGFLEIYSASQNQPHLDLW